MKSTAFAAAVAIGAATLGTPLLARDHASDREQARDRQHAAAASDQGMQAVPNGAGPGQASYGWRYFSDPDARRAVVISPQGDYYFSRGKGLRRVTAAKAET